MRNRREALSGEAWLGSRRKKAMDMAVAGSLLPAALPLIIGGSALVACVDGVNPHFKQTRYGNLLKPFTIHKIRTMPKETIDAPSNGPVDIRASRVGYFLRRTHVDELPQLLNVLAGDMSMVGPRPINGAAIAEVMDYLSPTEQKEWLLVRNHNKGGVIDPYGASAYQDGQTIDPRTRALADIQYIREDACFQLDAKLLLSAVGIMRQGLAESGQS